MSFRPLAKLADLSLTRSRLPARRLVKIIRVSLPVLLNMGKKNRRRRDKKKPEEPQPGSLLHDWAAAKAETSRMDALRKIEASDPSNARLHLLPKETRDLVVKNRFGRTMDTACLRLRLTTIKRWPRLRPHWRRFQRRLCDNCPACAHLGEPRYMVCSGCGIARYCSEECQREHWPFHQAACLACRDTDSDSSFEIPIESLTPFAHEEGW